MERGKKAAEKGELSLAAEYFRDVEELLAGEGAEYARARIEANQYLMKCYESLGDYSLVFDLYNKVNGLLKDSYHPRLAMEHHKIAGTLWWKIGLHHNALDEYEVAEELARKTGDAGNVAAVLLGVGLVETELGQFDGAEAHFNDSIDILNGLDRDWRDDINLGLAYNNRGLNSEYRGDYEDALADYQRCVEHARRIGNAMLEERGLVNAARALVVTGRFEEGRDHIHQAELLDEKVGSDEFMGGLMLARAMASLYEGELDQAREYHSKADEMMSGRLSTASIGAVAYIWGRSLNEMGLQEEAAGFLRRANDCYTDIGNETLSRAIVEMISAS